MEFKSFRSRGENSFLFTPYQTKERHGFSKLFFNRIYKFQFRECLENPCNAFYIFEIKSLISNSISVKSLSPSMMSITEPRRC